MPDLGLIHIHIGSADNVIAITVFGTQGGDKVSGKFVKHMQSGPHEGTFMSICFLTNTCVWATNNDVKSL